MSECPEALRGDALSDAHAVSFGVVEDRAIFVDERDDSYFMLDAITEERFRTYWNRPGHIPADVRAALGLEASSRPLIVASCAVPRRSLLDDEPRRSGFRVADFARAARLLLQTRRALKVTPIHHLLDALRASRPARATTAELAAGRSRFAAARRLVPLRANCLLDSMALAHWFGPVAPSDMQLVFGAKLDPFGAHCWLQSGDLLINDRLEYVARFAPVRVVPCSRASL